MNYISYIFQFFAKKDLATLYLKTKLDIVRQTIEDRQQHLFVFLKDFVRHDMNSIIINNVHMLYFENFIYVFDDSHNYVKIEKRKNSYHVQEMIVYQIKSMNETWKILHETFVELCVGIVRIIPRSAYFSLQSGRLCKIPAKHFAVYNPQKELQILCVSEKRI